MNCNYTPGPWFADGVHIAAVVDGDIYAASVAVCVDDGIAGDSEKLANARLIAAAPELLRALEAFDRGLRDGSIKWAKPRQRDSDPYHPANVAMCAAIARARGE